MKNYLIIGHSTGIGAAISAKLSSSHRVYGTYFKNPVEGLTPNVSSHLLNVLDQNLDVSFLPDSLDGLVYCPGAIYLKPFARLKSDDFLDDYQLQVLGAIKVIQACLPKLKNADNPSIVLFSTVAVQMGFNFHSVVASSKGAIEGLMRALAAELAPKVRINCIAPSITQTPLASSLLNTPEKIEANAQRHPLKKIGTPHDIAAAAVYLLSDDATWVTGQILHIDGGVSSVKS